MIHHFRDLGRGQARKDLDHLGARAVDVDDLAGDLDRRERHHLLGDVLVDGVVGDEELVEVELRALPAIHLGDDAVFYLDARARVVRAAHGDQADFRPFRHEAVLVDFPRVQDLKSFLSFSHRAYPPERSAAVFGRVLDVRDAQAGRRCAEREAGAVPSEPSSRTPTSRAVRIAWRTAPASPLNRPTTSFVAGRRSQIADHLDVGRLDGRIDHQHADARGGADAQAEGLADWGAEGLVAGIAGARRVLQLDVAGVIGIDVAERAAQILERDFDRAAGIRHFLGAEDDQLPRRRR